MRAQRTRLRLATRVLVLLALPLLLAPQFGGVPTPVEAVSPRGSVAPDRSPAGVAVLPGQLPADDDDIQPAPAPTDARSLSASRLDQLDDGRLLQAPSPTAIPTRQPNIVLVLIDDFGSMDERIWNYLPALKSLFIDRGTLFSNYVGEAALCCPGRANLLTGQHTFNHGVIYNDARLLNPSMTIATQLQAAGYHTFISGKYFNATEWLADKTPPGWDETHIYSGGYYGYTMYNNGAAVYRGSSASDYSTDVIADKAVIALKAAPPDRPAFAYLAPYAVHEDPSTKPYPVVPPRYADDPRCADIPPWDPPNYNEADTSDKPAYVQKFPLLADSTGWTLVPYCRALLAVDEMVGRFVDELKAQGRYDNTLFILTADNGMNFGAHRAKDKKMPYAVQMPLYVSWPSRLGTEPRTIEEPVVNIDVAPTLCEVAGCAMGPYPNGQSQPDGRSFLPLLLGRSDSMGRDAILEDHLMPNNYVPRWYGVQTTSLSPLGPWRYVEYVTGERELYDLRNGPCHLWNPGMGGDPCELTNLLGPTASPDAGLLALVDALHARLVQLKAERGGTTSVQIPRLAINDGAVATTDRTVKITLTGGDAASGVTDFRLSNDGVTWGDWNARGGSGALVTSWVLPAVDGAHTVYAEWRDGAGNISLPGSSAINLDRSALQPRTGCPSMAVSASPRRRACRCTSQGRPAQARWNSPMTPISPARAGNPTRPSAAGRWPIRPAG